MKHLNYLLTLLITMLWGTGVAKADVVQNYKVDFNSTIETKDHDFKVASGWGHIVDAYESDDDESYGTYYVEYSYFPTVGVDGSGALKIGSQTIGDGWYSRTVYDMLVTPAVTGTSSIYVKKVSTSSSISFYKVTTDANGNLKKGASITVDTKALGTADFVKLEIPAQEGERIGIRGYNVYIDNFEAEQVEYTLKKSLKVTNLTKSITGYDVDCDATNHFPISLKATIQNNGDYTINPGDENYSLSVLAVVNKTDEKLAGTQDITVALAPGEKTDVELNFNVDYAEFYGYLGFYVRENLGNTTSTYKQYYQPVAYVPKMELRTSNYSTVTASDAFSYGMVSEPVSKAFKVKNAGAAPLNVTEFSVPEGFTVEPAAPFTVDAHGEKDVTITFTAAAPGVFSGNVTVKGEGVDDITFAVSGTVLDPTKFFCNFEDKKLPAGSIVEGDWKVDQRDYMSSDNVYLLTNGTQGSEDKFITPLLRVAEGEKMTVDVARTYYNTAGENVYLKVYYSDDRANWTLAKTIKSSELSSKRAISYTYGYGELTTFVIDNVPAGDHYIGFAAGYTSIDNVYGFEKVSVAHDMMISENNLPATGMVNNKYTAKMTVKNINAAAEAAGSYAVALYVDGEKVAEQTETPEIAADGTASYELAYTPHAAGVHQTYIELKNLTDNYSLKTAAADVTIVAETAAYDAQVGEATGADAYEAPIYFYNADNALGADCDILYTAAMLKAYGLSEGKKISSITFTGMPATSKTFESLNLYACVGAVDEATYAASEKEDGMTKVTLFEDAPYDFKSDEPFVTKIQLPEPIVWDGVQGIRVRTHVAESTRKYIKVMYKTDKAFKTAYCKTGSSSSFNNVNTPVATFGIVSDPSMVSGKVACGETPVAGAEVRLTNDDVYYTATTAEDGTYSMPVFQTDKKYALTVKAEGYDDYAEADSVDVTASVVKDAQLVKTYVAVSGSIAYRKTPLAGVKVVLAHEGDEPMETLTDEDGKFSFDKVRHAQSYTLTATKEGFRDYAAKEPVAVEDADVELPAIAMFKPMAKVVGAVMEGETPMVDAKYTFSTNNTEYGTKLFGSLGDDGKFNIVLPQDVNYMLTIEKPGYETYALEDSISFGPEYDFGVIQLKPLTVDVVVSTADYMPYSSEKALDFSSVEGMKAYVVTDVKAKNDAAYVVLAEVTRVPANTGVLLKVAAGSYKIRVLADAATVQKNLLVATGDKDYAATDKKNIEWTLGKDDKGAAAFVTADDITVNANSAFLRYESNVENIYLDENDVPELDAIHGVSYGTLDLDAPMYNLSGQKVGKEYKGIVIQNGKKYSKK